MIRLKIFIANILVALPLIFASVAVVKAAPTETTEKIFGACAQAPDSPACKGKTETDNPVVRTIRTAANIIASITGIAAVIIVMIGGLSYITAGGNAEQATNARRRIAGALIGLIVVALAWAATRFVTDRVVQ